MLRRLCGYPRALTSTLLLGALVGPIGACTSVGDEVRRAEQAFSEARYEEAEAWLGDLEPSLGKMSTPLRARYYYLAGMSAYRIGERAQARHALALCREELEMTAEKLPAAWMHNLHTALDELTSPSPQAEAPTTPGI